MTRPRLILQVGHFAALALTLGAALTVVCHSAEPLVEEAMPERPLLEEGEEDLDGEAAATNEYRLREGLKLDDEVGEFRDAGGRIRFYPSDREITLTVLENLLLERVSREIGKRRERRQWSVSGVVTEYRGGNYLLITHAVVKPKVSVARDAIRPGASPTTSAPRSSTQP